MKGLYLSGLAFLLAVIASAVLLVMPFYSGAGSGVRLECDTAGNCREIAEAIETRSKTLFEVNGPRILGVLAVPVAITGLAFALSKTKVARTVRTIATVILLMGTLVSMFSIGMFYIPSLIALALSAVLPTHKPRPTGKMDAQPIS